MRIFCNNITGGNAIATAILAVGLTLASGTAFAVPDSEVNETFATRNIFGAGTTSVEGSLSQTIVGTLIFSTDDALVAGEVDQFTITGQAVGASFIAETSDGSGSPPGVDTVLGVFSDNTFTTLLLTDDDSGPGLGSRIEGVANGAGEINVAVSAFSDFSFDGSHSSSGTYSLAIFDRAAFDLVDFLSFTGLQPGASFEAETTSAGFDTILGLFDDAGALIGTNDDGGAGLLSLLTGTVGASGTVNLAVSAFSDFGFTGDHGREGDYVLAFSATASSSVPEPGALALFGIGLAGLGYMRRCRKAA